MSLEAIQKALDTQGEQLSAKFSEYEKTMAASGTVSEGLKADLNAMAGDYESLKAEQTKMSDAMAALAAKGVTAQQEAVAQTMGQEFTKSASFDAFKTGQSNKARFDFQNNTIVSGNDNSIVPLQTLPGIVAGAFRSLTLLDIIPVGTASGNTVHYTRELLSTQNAAETAEGAQKPESVLTFEGVDTPVRTIAHFIKVSKQVLDDAPALQSYIDTRLAHGARNRLEAQILNGDGTGMNLSGILAAGNHTNVVAQAGDTGFDYANRLKYGVAAADYNADAVVVNPADWGNLERLKDADGRYIGRDALGYLQNGLVPTIWGLPVVASNNVPVGKMICFATDAMMYWQREGVAVEMFEQDGDNVQKNLLTIRAEMRGAFSVFRPAAVNAGTIAPA